MEISLLITEILEQNQNLVVDYCNTLDCHCENDDDEVIIPDMAIYGKFLSKLPYNNVDFIKVCLELFTARLKAECRKLNNDKNELDRN